MPRCGGGDASGAALDAVVSLDVPWTGSLAIGGIARIPQDQLATVFAMRGQPRTGGTKNGTDAGGYAMRGLTLPLAGASPRLRLRGPTDTNSASAANPSIAACAASVWTVGKS